MGTLVDVGLVLAVLLAGAVAVVLFVRSLDEPGARDAWGGGGDLFGPLNEIFHPAQHRAAEDLRHHEAKREVAPDPDGDDPGEAVHLLRRPDGTPYAVRVQRPRREPPDDAPDHAPDGDPDSGRPGT